MATHEFDQTDGKRRARHGARRGPLGARYRKPRRLLCEALEIRICPDAGVGASPPAHFQLDQAYGQIPLAFEVNRGQAAAQVDYLARGSGYTLALSHGNAMLELRGPSSPESAAVPGAADGDNLVLGMTLVGAAAPASAVGLGESPGASNYFIGDDPSRWLTGINRYAEVDYPGVYPGIDITYHGTDQRQLEYDFNVAPGADPRSITLAFSGADQISLDDQGGLVLDVGGRQVRQPSPVVYQEVAGARRSVSSQFVLDANDDVGFAIGEYDPTQPLIIDPILIYSTYLGGTGADLGTGIAVGNDGAAYIVGTTTSTDIQGPSTRLGPAAFETAFVAKLDPSGQSVAYVTYLGGSALTDGEAVAVDPDGEATLTGYTEDLDFPLKNPLPGERKLGGDASGIIPGGGDAFVTRLTADGAHLIYSTYLGGADLDRGNAIGLDASGDVFVVGDTNSQNLPNVTGTEAFPVVNAVQPAYGGGAILDPFAGDAFVSRLHFDQANTSLSLAYSTYLGGSFDDSGTGVAVDLSGNVYVTGFTYSFQGPAGSGINPFPTTAGAFQVSNRSLDKGPTDPNHVGLSKLIYDAFVTKFSPAGGLAYSSYLGGGGNDFGYGIAVDSSGRAYVVGATDSRAIAATGETTYPVSGDFTPYQATLAGNPDPNNPLAPQDAVLSVLSADGSTLDYSTYFGGSADEYASAVALDAAGEIFLAGTTQSIDLLQLQSQQPILRGKANAFVTKFHFQDPSGNVPFVLIPDYSTYLGGTATDGALGLAVDPRGSAYVTGFANSTDFKLHNPVQGTFGGPGNDPSLLGSGDAFVARISGDESAIVGLPIQATRGREFSGAVATFTLPDPSRSPGDFSATIDWGDGQTSPGALVPNSGQSGPIPIIGFHRYVKTGGYVVVATVRDTKTGVTITPDVDASRLPENQAEENIAVDPNDSSHLFIASNTNAPTGGLFVAFSVDGGLNWSRRLIADGNDTLPVAASDAQVAWDSLGNLFLTYADLNPATRDRHEVVVVTSADGGQSFTYLQTLDPGGNSDQPSIAVGPGPAANSRSVWVSYANRDTGRIMVAGAEILGKGRVNSFTAPSELRESATTTGRASPNFGSIAVGPTGKVMVIWQDDASVDSTAKTDIGANILVSVDDDGLGPHPFAPPSQNFDSGLESLAITTAFGNRGSVPATSQEHGVDAEANLAFDTSFGPNRGRAFIAYTDSATVTTPTSVIRLIFSDDYGMTWSQAVSVDASTGQDSLILPSIAVDPLTGDVAVGWYDTRNDASHTRVQFVVAVSTNSGMTFGQPTPVGLGFSNANDPNLDAYGKELGLGDYTSLVFENGVVHAAWADNSASLPGNPNLPQLDAATAGVAVARVADAPVLVDPVAVDAVEGQQFDGHVAFVPDLDSSLPTDNYTATVDWGDGHSSPGTVSPTTGFVDASHTYTQAGNYLVVVTVHDSAKGFDSTSTTDVSAIAANQAGGIVAQDPSNNQRLFAVSNHESVQGLFAATSFNGGLDWVPVGLVDHLIADGSDALPVACCDPTAVFDQYGNLFLAYVDKTLGTVVVLMSADGGRTFQANPVGVFSTGAVGQPVLAVSDGAINGAGRLWVAFPDLSSHTLVVAGAAVFGLGQVGGFTPLEAVPGSTNVGAVGGLALGDNGEVLITFQATGLTGAVMVDASLDDDGLGPHGLSPPVVVGPTNMLAGSTVSALGAEPLSAYPRLAWAHDGLHKGTVYVAYTSLTPDGSHSSIVVQSSTDYGRTWSPASSVAGGGPSDAFFPDIAVDRLSGGLGIAWYDTRDSSNNVKTRVYASTSTDGKAFQPAVAVTTGYSDATDSKLSVYGQNTGYGGPVSLGYVDGMLVPLWSDNSLTLPGNPDRSQFDIAAAPIDVAHVADALLTVGDNLQLQATKGRPFSGVLATFTDANPFAVADDFTATVNWADGSPTESRPVTARPGGGFEISGTHTFTTVQAGLALTVTILDKNGSIEIASPVVTVVPPLSAAGVIIGEYKDRPFQDALGTFVDVDAQLGASDYTATIDWGDGTSSPGQIQAVPGTSAFLVLNAVKKTFSTIGSKTLHLTILSKDNESASTQSQVDVSNELTVVVKNIVTFAGAPFSAFVASLNDADPKGTANQYTASVDWGDGTPADTGVVTPDPNGNGFLIAALHTFAKVGVFPLNVSVQHSEGPQASASGSVAAQGPTYNGASLNLSPQGFEDVPTGAAASFPIQGPPGQPGDYTGSIDWGDGTVPTTATVTLNGSMVEVDGSHAYAQGGNFDATVTLDGPFGTTANAGAPIDVAADVSGQLNVDGSGLTLNPQTLDFNGHLTVTNTSAAAVSGPVLDLVFSGLPPGVQLVGASGSTPLGDPFLTYDLNLNTLAPGQSLPPIDFQLTDPNQTPFSYKTFVYSDPPAWYDAAIENLTPASGSGPGQSPLALGFEPNRGQADSSVQFITHHDGVALGLGADGSDLTLPGGPGQASPSSVSMRLVGARAGVQGRALQPEAARVNYLVGSDPAGWLTQLPTFGQVVYSGVYPGIDLLYRGNQDQVEYDFAVAPGANPNLIRMTFGGADSVSLDAGGNLVLQTAAGVVVQHAPVLYQKSGEVVRAVSGGFVIGADGQVGFQVGTYDRNLPLVIDPVLGYSTYFGGASVTVYSVAVDSAGNSYIAGEVEALLPNSLPLMDPLQATIAGGNNAFIAKFDPSGQLLYSTFLGGDRRDTAFGIAVDALGNAYVSGETSSDNFPTAHPLQRTLANPVTPDLTTIGPSDAFLAKLSTDGSSLVYSTYLGGQSNEVGTAVAVDSAGNAYVTGFTASTDFPTANPLQPHLSLDLFQRPTNDVFVTKVNPTGSALVYSTYLGGDGNDTGSAIAVDSVGDAYVTGHAQQGLNRFFPTTPDAVNHSSGSAFYSKLSPDGSVLQYSTFIGGPSSNENASTFSPRQEGGIALDSAGNIYVAGGTTGFDFPTTANAFQPTPGALRGAGFLVKYTPAGQVVYSTYLRGAGQAPPVGTEVYGLAVDRSGDAFVVGFTNVTDFPTKDPIETAHSSQLGEGFLTEFDPTGSSLIFSTYLGGNRDDYALGVAVDSQVRAFVVGQTGSTDFPTTPGALQDQHLGGNSFGRFDGFLARIDGPVPPLDLGTTVNTIAATEGIPFQAMVASFADPRPNAPATDFAATIDWGDGTTSAGAVSADPAAAGHFLVAGAHTFSEENTETVTVAVSMASGPPGSSTGSSTATVSDAPITAVGASVTAIEGSPFHGRVATLYDASALGLARDFTAQIDWGDGQTSAGEVTADATLSGQYKVEGNHTYQEAGAYPVKVAVADAGGSRATALGTVAASSSSGQISYHITLDPSGAGTTPRSILFQFNPGSLPGSQAASATISHFAEIGAASAPVIGPFQLDNSKILNELMLALTSNTGVSFDLTIAGDAVEKPAHGHFGSVFAVQLLASDGKTPLRSADRSGAVFIVDLDPDGNSTARTFAAGSSAASPSALTRNVADAGLTATGESLHAGLAQAFSGTVASFTDANPFGKAADFVATIAWGDGHTSSGLVTADGKGGFVVQGSNTFATPGTFPVSVTITDIGGSSALVHSSADIAAPTGPGGPVPPIGDDLRWVAILRFGIHMQRTRLELIFNSALDPTSAQDPRNYRIVAPEPERGRSGRVNQVVRIDSAIYDPNTFTVTLIPHLRLDFHYRFRVTVHGTPPRGLLDASGRAFRDSGSGLSGSDQTMTVTRRNLVLKPRTVTPRGRVQNHGASRFPRLGK
jgi:hypothetical protein